MLEAEDLKPIIAAFDGWTTEDSSLDGVEDLTTDEIVKEIAANIAFLVKEWRAVRALVDDPKNDEPVQIAELVKARNNKLLDFLVHMHHCAICGDGPWNYCETGREAEAVLTEAGLYQP